MTKIPIAFAAACLSTLTVLSADYTLNSFKKQQLDKYYWSEGAMLGDLNKDGKPDAISGPYWWEGPAFTKRHEIYAPAKTTKTKNLQGKEVEFPGFEGNFGSKNAYSTDNFFAFVHDFNGDGWGDVLTYGLPNTPAFLYLNPKGREQHWERHTVLDHVDNESPTFTDITGDGKPEIVCCYEGNFGYASPDWSNPTAKWTFHNITPKGNWQRFTHGLGVSDLNSDGKLDILFKDGWFEQPSSLEGDPAWKYHKVNFAPASAQMYAYDVNGDGRADVITALAAHGYGLAWHEQLAEKDANGSPKWRSHVFMHKAPEENRYGVHFSELHAVELFDVDGDGLKDIITGNCYWAHGPAVGPGPGEEGVLYWFKLVRNADKSVDWVPHLIDSESGVGRQIGVGDVNGDGKKDLIIGNKLGTFVFTHEAKKVSQEAFAKAQPAVKFASFVDQPLEKMSVIVHTTRPNGTPAVVQPAKGDDAAPKAKTKAAPKGAAAVAPVVASTPSPNAVREGIVPAGKDGKPLNLALEDGTLKDWTTTGEAFKKQPIKGDTVVTRLASSGRKDRSDHEGQYWVGGFELGSGDNLTGTLTSVPFKVSHAWATFLVGGGSHAATRVELVSAADQKVLFKTSGRNTETMAPVVVDLQLQLGKEIFIRLVDEQKGGWGHINFDDFKFHDRRPAIALAAAGPAAVAENVPPTDDVKFAGLSAEEAAKAITLPPGFKATLFAGEPDVKQPIAMCLDDRGRLWVVENYTYPIRQPEGKGTDRILVFEDVNGDGKFDRRTVFIEGLNLASAIEYGFGGVFVGAAPYLYFIPVKDGAEPKPAGKPQVLLEGWAYQDSHEMLNTFIWGPDGWLYGCHGVFTHSHVKRPDQPDSERQFINAGVWRYHPVKKTFEVFAEGTSNPWGLDFDERGQLFIEACVIPHLFHMIQGARYHRQGGEHYAPSLEEAKRVAPQYFAQDFGGTSGQPENPYTFKDAKLKPINTFIYDDIKTIADHVHYAGSKGPHAGNNRSDVMGGGHAHAGLMVYLGGSWPEQYRGKLFMNNIHGQRINMDVPERKGSGFVGKHGADFANFNDKWSQVLYMIDWYDKQQCHNQRDPNIHDRSNGRIFKISYGDTKTTKVDLQKASDEQLVGYLSHKNAWYAKHSQRILQERFKAAVRKERETPRRSIQATSDVIEEGIAHRAAQTFQTTHKELRSTIESSDNTGLRLRALWTLHTTHGLRATSKETLKQLDNKDEFVRAWTIQLVFEDQTNQLEVQGKGENETRRNSFGLLILAKLSEMAKSDPSPVVRLYLASACQRLGVKERVDILEGLVAHAEDAQDHNLPLMYWYALEPVVGADSAKAVRLMARSKIPVLREYITRRMTAGKTTASGGQ
jgi:putative membrane-bound dehydrogenase-like protein